jgi:16S rRNA (uracil1498-N3)-methyltransferase
MECLKHRTLNLKFLMRCFYCENLNVGYADLYAPDKKHLFSVLRARENSRILLIDGKGGIATGVVESNRNISIHSFKQCLSPQTKVHLYVSPPRKQKMDLLLAQCTEAGVWEIHPVFTENSVALPGKETTVARWRLKLIEACKQSHNPFIPQIYSPVTFSDAIKSITESNIPAFFGSTDFNEKNRISPSSQSEVAWIVGPEGGFTQEETELMINTGFHGISIGKWIMRVETAAVTGVTLLQL